MPDRGQLLLLLSETAARDLSARARRLTDECTRFRASRGYRKLMLWTPERPLAARHLYALAGFRKIDEETSRELRQESSSRKRGKLALDRPDKWDAATSPVRVPRKRGPASFAAGTGRGPDIVIIHRYCRARFRAVRVTRPRFLRFR